jgi:hypothetical protein
LPTWKKGGVYYKVNAKSSVHEAYYCESGEIATFVARIASADEAGESQVAMRAAVRSSRAAVTACNISSVGAGLPDHISNWRAAW